MVPTFDGGIVRTFIPIYLSLSTTQNSPHAIEEQDETGSKDRLIPLRWSVTEEGQGIDSFVVVQFEFEYLAGLSNEQASLSILAG